MLFLTKPSVFYENSLLEYREKFLQSGEDCDGSSNLLSFQTIKEWLSFLKNLEDESSCPPSLVPSFQYILSDENINIYGMINLRLQLNNYLFNFGGQIGYSIRPDSRQKGFGKLQLHLLLPICESVGLKRVLLTCDDDNTASQKIIEANGGIYEDSRVEPLTKVTIRRYWIYFD